MSRAPRLLPVLLALLGGGCGDAGPESMPGTLTAVLVSPHGPEGAAWLELLGRGVGQVTAADGRTFSHQAGDTVRVVVVRDAPGEIRFQVSLADTRDPPAVQLLEVADGENRLRAGLGAYRVEMRP